MISRPQRPAPIRTDDSNGFASDTMKRRIPAIIDETIQLNPDYPPSIRARLENLRGDVANGKAITPLDIESTADYLPWRLALRAQQANTAGDLTWHNAEWFFAETYVYRQLIEAVRWHESGRDPFLPKKQTELDSDALWNLLERALRPWPTAEETLMSLLAFDLWANRIDLSYAASTARGTAIAPDDLLVDQRAPLLDYLHGSARQSESPQGEGAVYIVVDNAGSELAMDLALADGLLRYVTARVVLCLKAHPTFVSDAMPADVWMMLDAMKKRSQASRQLAQRLTAAWNAERLRFVPHLFWNSSAFLWDLPSAWRGLLNAARLLIIKGDANYRRAVGDGLWAANTPFADVLGYLDAPVLCLRTLKSDPIVGLPTPETAVQLDLADASWRTNGKRGLIQFKPRTSNSQQVTVRG